MTAEKAESIKTETLVEVVSPPPMRRRDRIVTDFATYGMWTFRRDRSEHSFPPI